MKGIMHDWSYMELFFPAKNFSTIFVMINTPSLKCWVPPGQSKAVHALYPALNNVSKVINLIN